MISESLNLLFIVLLILANGVFAMSEIAVISARKTRLQQLAEDGDHKAQCALDLANSPNHFLSAVQIGITLVGVLSGVFGGYTIASRLTDMLSIFPALIPYAETLSLGLVVLIMTYLSLVFGELAPKRFALNDPERIAMFVAKPMRFLSIVASPVVTFLSVSTQLALRLVGMTPSPDAPVSEEEIKILIEQATLAGVFEEAEQEIVERVFRLGDRRVGVLMTPRGKVTWIDVNEPPDKILRKIAKSPHTRFPVCQGRLTSLLGVLHVRDLALSRLAGRPFDLKSLLHQPIFVLETTHALKVLEMFKESGNQMAMIIDEYGTVEGVVTLTDILEAIVGDLSAFEPHEDPKIVVREDGSWLVDGLLPLDELKEHFNIKELPHEKSGHFHTLGGFVMTYLKRIPTAGDSFDCAGLHFEIMDMDGRRVDKVLIQELAQPDIRDNL
jgi:putative hemolysin